MARRDREPNDPIPTGSSDPPTRSSAGAHARRSEATARVLRVVKALLSGEKVGRKRAMALGEVDGPAATRLLSDLRELDELFEPARGHGLVLQRRASLNPKPVTRERAAATSIAASLGALFADTGVGVQIRALATDVTRAAGRPEAYDPRKFHFVVQGGDSAIARASQHLDLAIDALVDGRKLQIDYEDFNSKTKTVLAEPLTLAVYEHQLYLIARTKEHRWRAFRFSRIVALKKQTGTFDYPHESEYTPKRALQNVFGIHIRDETPAERVVVRLAARWRAYAKAHKWHESQIVHLLKDGVLVELNVRVCAEVKEWIRGFGAEAEVLEPAGLRAEIAADLRKAADRYDTVAAPSSESRSSRGRRRRS